MVAILEDDAVLARLAVDLCIGLGLRPDAYPTPAPFLDAVRAAPPAALVLDWRLQDQLERPPSWRSAIAIPSCRSYAGPRVLRGACRR